MESENINKESGNKYEVSILHILNVSFDHVGEYICHASNKEIDFAKVIFNVTLPARIVKESPPVKAKLHEKAKVYCIIEGYPFDSLKWYKDNEELSEKFAEKHILSKTLRNFTLEINELTRKDNGTYICFAQTSNSAINGSTAILVLDKPHVALDFVKAVGKNKVYLNWTVNDGNSPNSLHYRIQYKESNESNWVYYQQSIGGGNRSYVLQDIFQPGKEYYFRIMAINLEGESQHSITTEPVTLLTEDPEFIPEVKVTGVTVSSITISWVPPPKKLKDHVHMYKLKSQAENSTKVLEAVHPASDQNNLYMFSDLHPATTYNFQIAACSDYTGTCGRWSEKVNGTTLEGIAGPPSNVTVDCLFHNISQTGIVRISWKPPVTTHGTIITYNVVLQGNATYTDELGIHRHTTWGPKITSVSNTTLNTTVTVAPNTNYTVRVSGVTRLKKNGDTAEAYCTMPPTIPDKQKLSKFNWSKVEDKDRYMFKLFMPRISERNGPICCYRVYLVRMEPQQRLSELPMPEELSVMSYQEAHRTPKGGAYVAEMFTGETIVPEVFLGDDQVVNTSSSPCDECVGLRPYSTPESVVNYTVNRSRRNNDEEPLPPYDGILDVDSNYTGFIEIVGELVVCRFAKCLLFKSLAPQFVDWWTNK